MELEDLILCAVCGFVVVPSVFVSLFARTILHRAGKYYLPDDALAEVVTLEPGEFVLEIPAGPKCAVMMRATMAGMKGGGKAHTRYGLNLTLDATRERPGQEPVALRRALALGSLANRKGDDVVAITTSYLPERFDGEVTHTFVLFELPAGGPAVVRGTLASATSVSYVSVFAKPA